MWVNPRYRRHARAEPLESAVGGGKSAYRIGRDFERSNRGQLERRTWFVIRSFQSKGPVDLLAVHPVHQQMMVQAKRNGQISSKDWNELWELAELHGCQAIITYRPSPKKTAWMRLTGPREFRKPGRPWVEIDLDTMDVKPVQLAAL